MSLVERLAAKWFASGNGQEGSDESADAIWWLNAIAEELDYEAERTRRSSDPFSGEAELAYTADYLRSEAPTPSVTSYPEREPE